MHFPDLLAIKYVHFCLSIKVNFFSFSLLTQDVMWMKKRFQNRQLWVCEIIERVPNLMVLVCSKPKNFLRRPAMVTEIEWTCWTLYAPFKKVLARPLNFKKILTSFYHTLWLLPLILFSDFNHTLIILIIFIETIRCILLGILMILKTSTESIDPFLILNELF